MRTRLHGSLVAGITKVQVEELKRHGVGTTGALATMPLPLPWKPERGVAQSFERAREQARRPARTVWAFQYRRHVAYSFVSSSSLWRSSSAGLPSCAAHWDQPLPRLWISICWSIYAL